MQASSMSRTAAALLLMLLAGAPAALARPAGSPQTGTQTTTQPAPAPQAGSTTAVPIPDTVPAAPQTGNPVAGNGGATSPPSQTTPGSAGNQMNGLAPRAGTP